MIFIAILFQNIGKFLCLRLFKTKLKHIRQQWNWKRFVYEFSGTIFLFLVSFIIYVSLSMYYKKVYLANDDVRYGVEVSEAAAAIGFRDGDKLVAINGEKLKEFRTTKIIRDILTNKEATIKINRNGELLELQITDQEKRLILESEERYELFKPKFLDKLTMTHENYSISETLDGFYKRMKAGVSSAKILIIGTPTLRGFKQVISPVSFEVTDFRIFLLVFQLMCLILVVINLIPLPGFDAGNATIALLERKRGKVYPAKKLFFVRLIGIGILISWILLSMFVL